MATDTTPTFPRGDLFVSPRGKDTWSGRLPDPNADGTDGPLATPAKARDLVRERKASGALAGPLTVWLREGRYSLAEPLTFGPEDSAPVSYRSYPSEQAILDGGRRIEGWQSAEVNGVTAWVAAVPEAAEGKWVFRQLFVNGERRTRARFPKEGYYWMEDVPAITLPAALFAGSDTFRCAPGDVQPWKNLTDVDIVAPHYWTEERMPVASFDPETRLVRSTRRSIFALADDFQPRFAKYYVENVFEALCEPGEWYLDRPAGRLYYVPMPGELPGEVEVVAPVPTQLLKLEGRPEEGRYVEFLRFEGLVFQHSEWVLPRGGAEGFPGEQQDFAASPQAAHHVPGAITLRGARNCAIEECNLRHLGWYGVDLQDGCLGNRIVGNEICDLGAGGVKVNGANAEGPRALRSGNNVITDNHVHHGGRAFAGAVGIATLHSFGNTVAHNHIHDFFYTGISCGWLWGYAENVSRDNRIEKNHIHHLGFGVLSDMGGIYTLGVQPGTVVRGNLIHHIEKANYGGWAIYPDEGSAHILIENNICYDTSSTVFHQHYGRENVVRNNIFALGREGQIALSRAGAHKAFSFERNIVVTDGQPVYVGGYAHRFAQRNFLADLNLFWDVSGAPIGATAPDKRPLEELQTLGFDRHSLVADPRFADLDARDFTLLPDSPAFALGFEPIDLSDVGVRPREKREA